MKCSEATNEISAALAKAQGIINNPAKKAENPHFKSSYADLSAGINAIREGLSVNGLAIVQATRVEADVLMLDTRLSHASGQWIEAEFPVCKFPSPPQVTGSALTYARRYSLFGMVGIAGEDDDGNAAKDAKVETPRLALLTPEQADAIQSALDQLPEDVEKGFLKHMKVGFVSAIPASQFGYAQDVLAKKLKAMAPVAEAAE